MSDTELGGQTLTVVRPGPIVGADDYNKPVRGPDIVIVIEGCDVQPMLRNASTEQMMATQDTIATRWRFFAPPGADILASDKVRCNIAAGDLQVDGEPTPWPDEHGGIDHVEGYLSRYTG